MRKGCYMDAKEGSVGENYLLGSAKVGLTNLNWKENLTSDRGDTARVSRGSITSTRELFRDLLLLANNALVFYSKSTHEHRCAAILLDLVISRLRRPYMAATSVVTAPVVLKALVRKLPVKPRSALRLNADSRVRSSVL
ncbi:hypothetical protein Nepgr_030531 [Nepenthes gracilis]|uniref:Bromo domain-containing protein n=1 Tax=Nepenthes gracilis TaxID=150966 RepID=A0AAD3TGQ3_NEPGR|nr:hypothetical protein Nepgr_030531 [Nepenthes gracilis]